MNIKEAKEQIKNAMTAYFTKDLYGDYIIPAEKQRPIFLMGPPGIGKTAIMEQIASEMGVGMVSYTMTHHTRQSVLGLPFISHKNYGGAEYDISQYTMSEIIASIYDLMEETGLKEGILFLDEINCVSETLAPVMLQFLQYKMLGRHKVPAGWIVVTAGNPPEYNDSVREFDIATWDRLKRIDVVPEFDVWKEYASLKSLHPAVMTYLETRKSDFYSVESTVDGKVFVTARGWDDLSQMIGLYEMKGLKVDEKLISQYIQKPEIAKGFAVYYDLFQKYKSDYQVDKILSGKEDNKIKERAKNAGFDERLALLGMLMDSVNTDIRDCMSEHRVLLELKNTLLRVKREFSHPSMPPAEYLSKEIQNAKETLRKGNSANNSTKDQQKEQKQLLVLLEEQAGLVRTAAGHGDAFKILKEDFDARVKAHGDSVRDVQKRLACLFRFLDEVFGEGQEMLIVVTELTKNRQTAAFISQYGCEEYFKHNKNLLLYDREQELMREIQNLDLR